MIKINEIFYSIQGESSYAGLPTVFIRTSGCPLRCAYCDTQYAYYEGSPQSIEQILEKVKEHGVRHVCVTGGEPLAQPLVFDLLKTLCDNNYIVSLETSGAISCRKVDSRVKKILDVKTPDSGEENSFCSENLEIANVNDEFKFVICSEQDFDWSETFCRQFGLNERFIVHYSPSHGKVDEKWLAKKILSNKSAARLHLQLHKIIWPDLERGI